MNAKDWPRAIISALVLALFAYAYLQDAEDEMMKGALIAAFTTAVSWWLGSSKGSSDKTDALERQATGKAGDPVHIEPDL